jgi:hypothetical protein
MKLFPTLPTDLGNRLRRFPHSHRRNDHGMNNSHNFNPPRGGPKQNAEVGQTSLPNAVANAATAKDPAFISDVSEVWKPGANVFKVATAYLTALNQARTLTQSQTEDIRTAIGDLVGVAQYSFNALVLTSDADVLTKDGETLRTLTHRSEMTGAERTWAVRYNPGDVLQYNTGSKAEGIERGSFATVRSVDSRANT